MVTGTGRLRGLVWVAGVLATLAIAVPIAIAAAAKPKTIRVDVSSSGAQATGGNSFSDTGEAISADGSSVAFASDATNLVPNDTNGARDIFVRELKAHKTVRVSVSSTGQQGNGLSQEPSISADGRFVAFASYASNLVSGDTNGAEDVFVRDLKAHKTVRVSVSSSGQQGNADSTFPSISADGRFVAFASAATNLVTGGTTGLQVFVHDMKTGKTTLVSQSSTGQAANSASEAPSMSGNGRFVAFFSFATNLVSGDTNAVADVFVRDLKTHKTTRVSVSSSGAQGNGNSITPSISATGRFVAFASAASNLVSGDTNAAEDVFVRDRQDHTTKRASLSSSGHQGNNGSYLVDPAITPNGRFVVFISQATNLVSGPTIVDEQIFLRDLTAGHTTLISQSSSGQRANSFSFEPSITASGAFVAFDSGATNLVKNDTNGAADVFVRGPLR